MNHFEIVEARWLGLNDKEPPFDARWIVRGRAHGDIKIGDSFAFGGGTVTVEEISTYGKPVEILSAGMTGDLTVRWPKNQSMLYLNR